jgi:hypothetical protein
MMTMMMTATATVLMMGVKGYTFFTLLTFFFLAGISFYETDHNGVHWINVTVGTLYVMLTLLLYQLEIYFTANLLLACLILYIVVKSPMQDWF